MVKSCAYVSTIGGSRDVASTRDNGGAIPSLVRVSSANTTLDAGDIIGAIPCNKGTRTTSRLVLTGTSPLWGRARITNGAQGRANKGEKNKGNQLTHGRTLLFFFLFFFFSLLFVSQKKL